MATTTKNLTDLEIVNPHETKSIIILSPEEFADPDAQVIKMILAITNNPNRRSVENGCFRLPKRHETHPRGSSRRPSNASDQHHHGPRLRNQIS